MVAILQLKGWQSYAALVYSIHLWYWTSMLWSIDTCQNKVSADQYHCTILQTTALSSLRICMFFFYLTTGKVLFSDWIAGSTRLACIWGRVIRKEVNANPRLKVNQITSINFSCIKMFLLLLFGVVWNHSISKQAKQYKQKTSLQSLFDV